MRIALIYLGRRGGGSTYSLAIATALARRAEVLAVVSQQAWNLKYWHERGLPLLEVKTYTDALTFVPSTLNIGKHLALRRHLAAFRPDVLYYPMLHLWAPLINGLFPNLPKVITVHDPVLHRGERNPIIAIPQRIATRQASRVIILSQAFVDTMERQGVPRDRIDVIPHGEFSHYALISTDSIPRKDNHAPTLLFFGRISKYKGLEVLLSAFPLIKRRVPEVRLLIVGSGDLSPYSMQLENLPDVMVVNRWVDDKEVASYFRQADLLVAPYMDASQSGVIPVAYSLGVPVVATRVGGIPEQVEHNKTGILVNANDPQALAEACVSLLTDPERAKALAEAGRRRALEEWSWDRIAEMVIESCRKAIGV